MLCVCFVAYFDSLYVVGSRNEAMNIRRLCSISSLQLFVVTRTLLRGNC